MIYPFSFSLHPLHLLILHFYLPFPFPISPFPFLFLFLLYLFSLLLLGLCPSHPSCLEEWMHWNGSVPVGVWSLHCIGSSRGKLKPLWCCFDSGLWEGGRGFGLSFPFLSSLFACSILSNHSLLDGFVTSGRKASHPLCFLERWPANGSFVGRVWSFHCIC